MQQPALRAAHPCQKPWPDINSLQRLQKMLDSFGPKVGSNQEFGTQSVLVERQSRFSYFHTFMFECAGDERRPGTQQFCDWDIMGPASGVGGTWAPKERF